MPLEGFKPTISEGERPQTYVLDNSAAWIGMETSESVLCNRKIHKWTVDKSDTI